MPAHDLQPPPPRDPVSPPPAGVPARIGPYRVLGYLGEGGMGRVHKAAAPDGRLVAVKVVRPEYAAVPEFRARFQREVASAVRVPRFCTAEVLGSALDGDLLYLVTEFIDGPTLHASVRTGGAWQAADLEQLGVSMAAALAAIHGSGVIHRDLKPSNVLLSRSGPRVIDFGVARALEATAGLTGTGHLIGTPGFVAPEQYRGASPTPAVDVFAWGGVMAFAATGRYPFGGGEPHVVAYRVVHDEPDLGGLDGDLRAVVAAALAKDPSARPAPEELQERLGARPASVAPAGVPEARVSGPEAPGTPASGWPPRQAARKPARRGRAGAFLTLVAALLLGTGSDAPTAVPRPPPATTTGSPAAAAEPVVFPVRIPTTLGGRQAGEGAGVIARPGETDVYRFTGSKGDPVFVEALACSPAPATATMTLTLTGPAGPVHLDRPQFCKSGVPVDPGPVTLPADGAYRLAVAADGGGTGTYGLRLRYVTRQQFDLGTGETVAPGRPPGAGEIEGAGDMDWYRFPGQPGEQVTLTAGACRLGGGVLRYILWKPGSTDLTGVVAVGELCPRGGDGGQAAATLPVGGMYQLTVDAGGHGDTGTYRLTLTRR